MQRWWKRGSEKHVRCGKCHSHVESQLLSILGCPNKNNIIDMFIHPGPSLSLYPKNNEFKKAGDIQNIVQLYPPLLGAPTKK